MERLETLAELVERLESRGTAEALIAFEREATLRLRGTELAARARRRASELSALGASSDTCVALFASNSAEWVVSALAVLRTGAVLCPIDAELGGEFLRHVLADAAPQLVITTREGSDRIERLELDPPPQSILLDAPPYAPRALGRGLENAPPREEASAERARAPHPSPEDVAVLFYTSGTTGRPKGVPLSHHKLSWQLERVAELGIVRPDDRVLLPLPLHHVYPFVIGLAAPLALGLPVVLPRGLTGQQLRRALAEGEASVLLGVPRLYRALSQALDRELAGRGRVVQTSARALLERTAALGRRIGLRAPSLLFRPLRGRLGPRLRLLVSGGAALDPELGERFEELGFDVATGYGLTEAAGLISVRSPGVGGLETAGRPLPGIELRIEPIAAADQELSPDRGAGEILVRGPAVFDGYRGLAEETAEAFQDSFFRTGDLGRLDPAGFLHVSGRLSTRIVTEAAERLQPAEIEAAYATHPLLREVAVFERKGRVAALVGADAAELRRRGRTHDPVQAVREAIAERSRELPSHFGIHEVAVTYEPIPRTHLGRPSRHLLESRFADAKRKEPEAALAERGPTPIGALRPEDRTLLEKPAAKAAWQELVARFPDKPLTLDSHVALDLGLDSLAWLDLGLAIEERSGVELDEESIVKTSTVRELLEAVAASDEGPVIDPIEQPEQVLSPEQQRWLQPLGWVGRSLLRSLRAVERVALRRFFWLRVEHLERVPPSGPFVLAPNHTSYLDPFVLIAVLPIDVLHRTHFAGWTGVAFKGPFFRAVSRLGQTVPIDPDHKLVSSLAFAAAVLERGRNLVWFPEGERSPDGSVQRFLPGIGRLLERYDVPVLPVRIEGTYEALPRDRTRLRRVPITVTFGVPVRRDTLALENEGTGERADEHIASALRNRVLALHSGPH